MAFSYLRPANLNEALAAIGNGAQPIAGGTILAPILMTLGAGDLSAIVDVRRLPELNLIQHEAGLLRIGAAVSLARIALVPGITSLDSALQKAARAVGNPNVRNAGTIGGNLVSSASDAALKPALLVLDAKVICQSAGRVRECPIDEFLKDGLSKELLVEVHVPLEQGRRSGFLKYGWRRATARSILNVAASLRMEDSKILEPRLSVGGITCAPARLPRTEQVLRSAYPSASWLQQVTEAAGSEPVFKPAPIAPEGFLPDSYLRRLLQEGFRVLLTELLQ
jgi:carbon-monoxide dehydrogenase medium subunit